MGGVSASAASPAGKGKLKLLLAIVIVVVVLGGAGAGAYMWYKQQNSPDHIFKVAVSNLFKTKSVTQTAKSSDVNGTVKYDVANIKDPKISAAVTVKSSDVTFDMATYGTLQNSYLKFKSFGNSTLDSYFSDVTNKWVQLRKDGTVPANINTNFSDMADPRVFVFGDFIFGNFSSSQQKTLTDFVVSNNIYKYDSKAVTTTTLDGKKTYVYPITENVSKLKDLNTKAAGYLGLSTADIKTALASVGGNDSVKLYVDASTKEFVKVTLTSDGSPVTNTYTDYDSTTLPSEPSADITWAQLENTFGNSL
ncbi:MAG TPA: hypothetical protein VHD60_02685 [Candidatus Saccharimonadales bacterium]|nr:hypothetical protein [Candidatus Saccharimonadales bacterium]